MKPVFRVCTAACICLTLLTGMAGPPPKRSFAALETTPTGREGKCGAVDLVIAMDTTHSMATAIRDVKREMVHLLDLTKFVSAGDYRLGLISFKDRITVEVDLGGTPDNPDTAEAISWSIRRLTAGGGNGGPEASDEALHTAVANLSAENRPQDGDFTGVWEARSRILVLVTDNLPGGFDDQFDEGVDDLNARTVTTLALDKDIRISSVYIPTSGFEMSPDPRVEQIMRAYAQLTGGVFAITQTSGLGAAEAIADIINRCGSRPLS